MVNHGIVLVCVLFFQILQLRQCDLFDFGEGGNAYKFHRKQREINKRQISLKATDRQSAIADSSDTCKLKTALVKEIQSYQNVSFKIINEATVGSFKGRTFNKLTRFVDTFGGRVSGTIQLEGSIDYMMNLMKNYGLDNVHSEEVVVPHYYRGEEKAELLEPRKETLAVVGLLPPVGTPLEGFTADVLVVTSFEDLLNKSIQAKGKIVVFNHEWSNYDASVEYRLRGAVAAAQQGAVAALVRSFTSFSMNTPHAGDYDRAPGVPDIPVASITVEDAEFLHRLQEHGKKMKIRFTMLNRKLPDATSRNVFGQLTGTELPYELVGVSGHIGSWDFGQGAMDDGITDYFQT